MSQQSLSKYHLLAKIGQGLNGDVYKAIIIGTDQYVAVKKIRNQDILGGVPITALRETSLLRRIQHKNVVKILEVEKIHGQIRVVMEYLNLDLQQYLSENKDRLSLGQIKKFMCDILQGVEACHRLNCIHRDIKPKNILIQEDGTLKIGDFGSARVFQKCPSFFTSDVCALWYRAPELLLGSNYYSTAIDMWAIGCVFAELLLKQPLFQGENEIHQLKLIIPNVQSFQAVNLKDSDLQIQFSDLIKKKLQNLIEQDGLDLILQLLKLDPDSRISCSQSQQHNIFIQYLNLPSSILQQQHYFQQSLINYIVLNIRNLIKMIKPMKMFITSDKIHIVPNPQICGFAKPLTIDRLNFTIQLNQTIIGQDIQEIGIFGIVGIYKFYGKNNLLYISEANHVCKINGQTIYEIVSISNVLQNQFSSVEQQSIKNIEAYFSKCTYFSLQYDLTIPLSQQCQPEQSERSMRFWWNFHGYKQFLEQKIPKCWCIKIIQGYVGLAQCEIKTQQKQQIIYILISRRETLRGGTRYNHRGLNIEGAAANTVETEQLIEFQEKLYCHLQIRGSVPVFWEQVGIRAISQITQNNEQTKMALTKHLMNLKKYFGSLLLVDLMSNDKPNETIISQTYKDMVSSIQIPQITLCHIDFKQYCKNYKFEKLNPLLNQNKEILIQQSYTKFQNGKLINIQNGVVRTNCLDCLDRTNVFQTKIAFFITNLILNDLGINIPKEFRCETILDLSDQDKVHDLIKLIKILWGESGDNISRIYAGTNSSTTKIQMTGGSKWTGMIEHGLKGFQRFYNQNVTDEDKQNIYSFIVGLNQQQNKQYLGIVEQIQQQSPQIQKNLLIMVISFNAKNKSIKDFFHLFDSRQIPQFIIVLFQNIVKICQPCNFIKDQMQSSIRSQLGQYECLFSSQNENQYSFIFAKSNIQNTDFKDYIIKQENREIGVVQNFNYCGQRFQILNLNVNCQELLMYEKKIIQQVQENGINTTISILGGICDSRIQIEESIQEFCRQNTKDAISKLFLKDELCQCFEKSQILKGYQEPNITFLPQNGQKGWMNRILYGPQEAQDSFNILAYDEPISGGIRLLFTIDFEMLELNSQKHINNDEEEDDDMKYSQQFYQVTDEDDFEIIT
ncbi:unnamed protein product [Paramecium sonneborni]|uniref:Uncharacterized protein n=1 Tax=Paramecium sonneborni TaxID=65129 RepID=A0A8S1NY70_9CILI|nr:unnamed protein product [Paramecium sonneborni]